MNHHQNCLVTSNNNKPLATSTNLKLVQLISCTPLRRSHAPHEGSEAGCSCDEGHEGDEGHQGHEGHEGEKEQDSAGKDGSFCRFPRVQREDWWWPDQGSADEEQEWQDCEQGKVCCEQEEVCNERAEEMDRCREVGAKAAQYHGLLRRERQDCTGEGFVRKGQEHSRQVISRGVLGRVSLHCS